MRRETSCSQMLWGKMNRVYLKIDVQYGKTKSLTKESLNPPSIDNPSPIWTSSRFSLYSEPPAFGKTFNKIAQMKYWKDTKINSRSKVKNAKKLK